MNNNFFLKTIGKFVSTSPKIPGKKMGSKQNLQIPIFTQTNLGTRIAIPVSPDITVRIFKDELEKVHADSFPELGFLSVDAVMVKRNFNFYHLSDLLPLKHVFKGFKSTWLLYVNASLSNNLPKINNDTKGGQKKRKKRKRKRKRKPKVKKIAENLSCEKLEQASLEPKGNCSNVCEREENCQQEVLHPVTISNTARAESPCESVSVSGIIHRYFTNLIDADHSASSSEVTPSTAKCDVEKCSAAKKGPKKQNSERKHPRLLPSFFPEEPNSAAVANKYERSEVGNRLVVASNNLGSSQRSALSKCKSLSDLDARSIKGILVFDIDNND